MAVDGRGRPLRVILTPGQRGDVTQAPALLVGLTPKRLLADKAYDSNALRQIIAGMNAEAVIPCNPTRKVLIPYDFDPTRPATSSSAASTSSSTSAASQPDTTDAPHTSSASSKSHAP